MTDETIRTLTFAARAARAYAAGVGARRVFPDDEALKGLSAFDEEFPERPSPGEETIALLDRAGSPASVATTGGRYFGFVTGASLPAALGADWLVSAWDQPALAPVAGPGVAAIEKVAARWTLDALALPAAMTVVFPASASYGSIVGLAAARRAVLLRRGWDVDERGLAGAPPFRVVIGAEAHSTLIKGLGVLGLGRKAAEIVPGDDEGRMRADLLPPLDETTIICAQAGNVNSGAFDPLTEISEKARAAGAWLHVDGAFGLWARASARFAPLAAGAEHADSLTTDGHKWLNTPYDCGIAIVRDRAMLTGAMSLAAAYLPEDETPPAKDSLIELSRRARGVTVWAALRSLGREGLAALIERTCDHARALAAGLSAEGFEIRNEVVLNQVVASFGDAARTEAIRRHVERSGETWVGPTEWRGKPAFRISVSSHATTAEDVARTIAAFRAARDRTG